MLRRPPAAFIVLTAALGIAACGIKGPLKPPPEKPAVSPTAPTPESPPAADNAKDKKQ